MSRRLSVVAGALPIVGLAVLAIWFSRSERFTSAPAAVAAATPAEAAKAAPRAVVLDDTHDLGVMSPGDVRRHKFVVRNEGAADLELALGSTTCKCTLANLDHVRIPPGGSDIVELEWRAEDPQFRFRQGAIIRTNDPALPSFELIGEGSVRVKLAALSDTAFLADVPRHTPRTLHVLIYSQAYREVAIRRIESTSDAVTAVLSADEPVTSPPVESRFFRDLAITVAPQTKAGRVEGLLRLDYVGRMPDGVEETGVYELPVAFDVVGDVTLHGRDLVGGTLVFGTILRTAGAKKQVYVHVRGDTASDLRLSLKRALPDVLQVHFGEAQNLTPTITRFPVTVELPPGAEPRASADSSSGEIELTTTHPDYPTVRIPLSLIVVP